MTASAPAETAVLARAAPGCRRRRSRSRRRRRPAAAGSPWSSSDLAAARATPPPCATRARRAGPASPAARARRWASSSAIDRPDELGRVGERRVVGRHLRLADQAHHLRLRKGVLERLQEEVADHPLGLGTEDVEGIGGREVGVGGALVGEQAHLRPVPVGDDQVVVAGKRCQRRDGDVDVAAPGSRPAGTSPRSRRAFPPTATPGASSVAQRWPP